MIILGLADGPDASASVVINNALVSNVVHGRTEGGKGARDLPWKAIDEALALAGVTRDQVTAVALAGRFSSIYHLRKNPWLHRVQRDFSERFEQLTVAWQGLLRSTGLGQYFADEETEEFEASLQAGGIFPKVVRTLDVHSVLAHGAYRSQDSDSARVLVVQPLGDGVAMSVHQGIAGQLDIVQVQKGLLSVHQHLQWLYRLCDLQPYLQADDLDDLSAAGEVSHTLVELLNRRLSVRQGLLVSCSIRDQGRLHTAIEDVAKTLSPAEIAASSLAHLTHLAVELVDAHGDSEEVLCLCGELFAFPRLVAAIGERVPSQALEVLPRPGHASLAVGAAIKQAGLAPLEREVRLGGCPPPDAADLLGLGRSIQRGVSLGQLVERLVKGGSIVWWDGQSGPGCTAMGSRMVLCRGDDPKAVDTARQRLGLSSFRLPLAVMSQASGLENRLISQGHRRGAIACAPPSVWTGRYGPVMGADGRCRVVLAEPVGALRKVIDEVHRLCGAEALAAFPLVRNGQRVITPRGASGVFDRQEFEGMYLAGQGFGRRT